MTAVRKWGNSLGIRLPTHICNKISIKDGDDVDVYEENGKIILIKKQKEGINLAEMLAKVEKKNPHSEVDWGVFGKEGEY